MILFKKRAKIRKNLQISKKWRNFASILRSMSIWKGILDIFFPPYCPLCDAPMSETGMICPSCLEQLEKTEEGDLRDNVVEDLFAGFPHFDKGGAFWFYEKEQPIAELIHFSKYGKRAFPSIVYYMAKEAAQGWLETGFFDGIEVIIPVPLHKKRLRERGFNQAEWIAKGISEVTSIPVDTTHLERLRNNKHQAAQSLENRQVNVVGLFGVNHPEEMYRKHILLVDDIITTGSTIRACLEAMKPFLGCHITVFALGKSR